MKKINLKIKRKNIILIAVSLLFLVISSGVHLSSWNEHKKIFEEDEGRADVLMTKLKMIEEQINKEKQEEVSNAELYIGLEKADKSFYYFKDKNKFINDFSVMLKGINGIDIYEVEYSKSDNLKQMRINIPFAGDYKAIREMVYRIESRFYFLKIEGLNIANTESGKVKGIVEIKAYFGDDSGEK